MTLLELTNRCTGAQNDDDGTPDKRTTRLAAEREWLDAVRPLIPPIREDVVRYAAIRTAIAIRTPGWRPTRKVSAT